MPDIATIAGGPGEDTHDLVVGTRGRLIPTARNAKGAWTEILAATTYDCAWMLTRIERPTDTGPAYLIDIGVGAAGVEQVLVPNLVLMPWFATTSYTGPMYLLPVRIPRGTRVVARGQGSLSGTGHDINSVMVYFHSAPITAPPTFNRVESLGINTATTTLTSLADPGATPNTYGAWTVMLASSSFAYRWMCVAVNCADNAIAANLRYTIDIGIGASGQEQAVISGLTTYTSTAMLSPAPNTFSFPVAIPAGSRVVARAQCSVGTAGDRVPLLALWGVG